MKLFAKQPRKRKQSSASIGVHGESSAAAAAAAAAAQKKPSIDKATQPKSQEEHDEFLEKVKAQCVSSTFRTLKLRPWIVKNCASLAIERPTPVQFVCIPKVMQGRDVVAGSPTGSGKTAAFALPLLHKLSADPFGIFSLVLTPTRELAVQIAEQFTALGAPIRLRVCTIIGGCSLLEQQTELADRPHVVVATPGRLLQHLIGPSPPRLKQLQAVVLDEADRLLQAEDFEHQVEKIFAHIPRSCQLLLFSATLSPDVEAGFQRVRAACGTARQRKALQLGVKNRQPPYKFDFSGGMNAIAVTAKSLRQRYLFVPQHMKLVHLVWLLLNFGPVRVPVIDEGGSSDTSRKEAQEMKWAGAKNAIVFVRHKHEADQMLELAREFEIPSVCLHSGLSQRRRQAALAKFKSAQMRLLFATDVASRGLDIPKVQLVINFDIPAQPSDYVHRVGRTARAGRDGVAISLMSQYDVARLHAIEEYIGMELSALEGTDGSEPNVDSVADATERSAALARHAQRKREIEDEVLALMNKTAKAWGVAELRLKAREAERDD